MREVHFSGGAPTFGQFGGCPPQPLNPPMCMYANSYCINENSENLILFSRQIPNKLKIFLIFDVFLIFLAKSLEFLRQKLKSTKAQPRIIFDHFCSTLSRST